jgi:hypothetical protein
MKLWRERESVYGGTKTTCHLDHLWDQMMQFRGIWNIIDDSGTSTVKNKL